MKCAFRVLAPSCNSPPSVFVRQLQCTAPIYTRELKSFRTAVLESAQTA